MIAPVVSYLTARPSRDVILAAHYAMTRTWWRRRRFRCDYSRANEDCRSSNWDIAQALRRRVKKSFEDQGIEIPVVQPVAPSKGDPT
jgi:hypothetical protein